MPFRFGCGDEVVSGRSKPLPYHDCGVTLRTVEDACPYKRHFTTYKKYDIINPKIHKRKAVGVIKNAIKKFLSFILAILIAVIFGVCLVFLLPFDYIKYKRSLYYKNTKKKYTFFDASNENFKIYNEINKNNLPINFIHHPKEKSLVYGWFVFEKTLIIVNAFNFEYDAESGRWVFSTEADEEEKHVILCIDEYIETEIEEVNQAIGDKVCDKAVILICADNLENAENAYKEERFLIYKNDMIERLKLFVKTEQ